MTPLSQLMIVFALSAPAPGLESGTAPGALEAGQDVRLAQWNNDTNAFDSDGSGAFQEVTGGFDQTGPSAFVVPGEDDDDEEGEAGEDGEGEEGEDDEAASADGDADGDADESENEEDEPGEIEPNT